MPRFVMKRVAWSILVLMLVTLATFLGVREIRGNPFEQAEHSLPAAVALELEREFNLGDAWYVQYVHYVKGMFTLDFGPSLAVRNLEVSDVIRQHLPVSMKLGALAMLFATALGVPLGIIAAAKRYTVVDYAASAVVNAGYALPSFLIGALVLYVLAIKLREHTPFPTTGWDGWETWVLPMIALGFAPMAAVARIVRGSIVETLQRDYIRTARAKGLRWPRIASRHLLRNTLIAVVTATGPLFGYLIAASFVVETMFEIPGIARSYILAVGARDYSVVMGLTIVLSLIIILANLVVDILHGYLDARTREAST